MTRKFIICVNIIFIVVSFLGEIRILAIPAKSKSHISPGENKSHKESGNRSKKSIGFDDLEDRRLEDDTMDFKFDENSDYQSDSYLRQPYKKKNRIYNDHDDGVVTGQMISPPKVILDEEPSKEIYLGDFEKKNKEVVYNTGVKKSIVCNSFSPSENCICERSCQPNKVYTYDPCQCIEITDSSSHNEEPNATLSYGNDDKSNLPPLFVNPTTDQSSNYIMPSTCSSMCSPYLALSENPCTCQNSPVPKSQIMGTTFPNSYSYATPSQLYQQPDMSFYNNVPNYYNTNPETYYSNYYPSPPPHQYHSDPNVKLKCKKACFPFIPKTSNPCTCNFKSYKSPTEYTKDMIHPRHNNAPHSRSSTPGDFDTSYDFLKGFLNPPYEKNVPYPQSPGTFDANRGSSRDLAQHPSARHKSPIIKRYIGCFKDEKEHGRDLKIDVPVEKLTVEKCIQKCRKKKKRFVGLQYGYLCFCGSRFGRYGRAEEGNCSSTCVGDPTQKCGGAWYNSIYSTDGQLYSETQFSFSAPDSIDEIKAEEEKRKLTAKSKKAKKAKGKPLTIKALKKRKIAKILRRSKKKHILTHNRNIVSYKNGEEDEDEDEDEENEMVSADKTIKPTNRSVSIKLAPLFGKRDKDSKSKPAVRINLSDLKNNLTKLLNDSMNKIKPIQTPKILNNQPDHFNQTQPPTPSPHIIVNQDSSEQKITPSPAFPKEDSHEESEEEDDETIQDSKESNESDEAADEIEHKPKDSDVGEPVEDVASEEDKGEESDEAAEKSSRAKAKPKSTAETPETDKNGKDEEDKEDDENNETEENPAQAKNKPKSTAETPETDKNGKDEENKEDDEHNETEENPAEAKNKPELMKEPTNENPKETTKQSQAPTKKGSANEDGENEESFKV